MAHTLPCLALALLITACSGTEAATDSADSASGQDPGLADGQVESEQGRYWIAIAPVGGQVPLSEEFDLWVEVEAAGGDHAPAVGAQITVTADMPAHGHGMNQEPTVTANGDGSFLAAGMLFHMSGHWEVIIDLSEGGSTDSARLPLPCCD